MPSKRHRSSSPSSSDLDTVKQSPHDGTGTNDPSLMANATSKTHLDNIFAYQEIFLRILSFLTPTELALVQCTSKYWSQMTLDQQVGTSDLQLTEMLIQAMETIISWYVYTDGQGEVLIKARYPHPHHSRLVYKSTTSSRSSTPQRQLRPIARLPSRAFPPPSPSRSPSASSQAGPSTAQKHSTRRGVAVPLGGRTDVPEVGYGVRNDGVDWKIMLRLGPTW